MMKDAFGAGHLGCFPSTGRSCPDVTAEEMKEVKKKVRASGPENSVASQSWSNMLETYGRLCRFAAIRKNKGCVIQGR